MPTIGNMPRADVREESKLNDQPSIWDACAASGGANGLDARGTNATSVRSCRLRKGARPQIRVSRAVRPTGGKVHPELLSAAPQRRVASRRTPKNASQRYNPAPDSVFGAWHRPRG